MASYNLKVANGFQAVQYDGTNGDELVALCPDALVDATGEGVAQIPGVSGTTKQLDAGDWCVAVDDGFLVLDDAAFVTLFVLAS